MLIPGVEDYDCNGDYSDYDNDGVCDYVDTDDDNNGIADDEQECYGERSFQKCSGHGVCRNGQCECETIPKGRYYGQYCECNDWSCPKELDWTSSSVGAMCGGHGSCHCGGCQCDLGWTGKTCSCSTEVESCTAHDGRICSDKGKCICGKCECAGRYTGNFCQIENELTCKVSVTDPDMWTVR